MNGPMNTTRGTRLRIPADLARYLRNEYGSDDPTWLLAQIRAPTKGARSFSPSPALRFVGVRRVARALMSILL